VVSPEEPDGVGCYTAPTNRRERYLSTGHHDDESGVLATRLLDRPSRQWLWVHFLVNTPTIVATLDAALAAAIVVLLPQTAGAAPAAAVAGGAVAFLGVWGVLFALAPWPNATLTPTRLTLAVGGNRRSGWLLVRP
jgi:hypothetical protein